MRSIKEILFKQKDVDIVLIQPYFLMRILKEDQNEIVKEYWKSMNNKEPLGDLPNEVNHGLFSIAASVLKSGKSVEVLDFQAYDMFLRDTEGRMINEDDIKRAIQSNKASVYGISTITVASENAIKIASVIKAVNPDSVVVFGGMHPTMYADSFIYKENVDIISLGEGNKSIVEILDVLINNRSLDEVNGIVYKNKSGSVIKTPLRSIRDIDLDEMPYPAYDLMCKESLPLMPRFFSSKGCPYNCAFCSCDSFFRKAYNDYCIQFRDPISVVDEIEYTYNKYRMSFYCFGDLTFMTDKAHVHAICKELIKRGLNNIGWWCQTTVGSLDSEDLALMKKAGCRQIGLGVENGVQDNLDLMGKPIIADEAEIQCRLIREAGIEPITYWIVGLGDKSFDDAIKTIKRICYFVRENITEVSHIGVPVPYPGSPLWNNPQKYGIEIVSTDFSNYWMNSDELGYSKPAIATEHLSEDHIYALWEFALMAVGNEYKKRNISISDLKRRCNVYD